MTSEHRMTARVEFESRPRWIVGERADERLRPTPGARVIDVRGSFASAQAVSGSGELCFEGEILEGLRLN